MKRLRTCRHYRMFEAKLKDAGGPSVHQQAGTDAQFWGDFRKNALLWLENVMHFAVSTNPQTSSVQMMLEPRRLLLAFRRPQLAEDIEASLRRLGMLLEAPDEPSEFDDLAATGANPLTSFRVRTASGQPIADILLRQIKQEFRDLDSICAVYRFSAAAIQAKCPPVMNFLLVIPSATEEEFVAGSSAWVTVGDSGESSMRLRADA